MLFEKEYEEYKKIIFESDEPTEDEKDEAMLDKDQDPDQAKTEEPKTDESESEKAEEKQEDSEKETEESDKSDEKSEEKTEEKEENTADKEKLAKTFVNAGFENTDKGVFVNKDFLPGFSVGVSFNTANESVLSTFEKMAYKIICEETEQITLTLKVKDKNTDEEKTVELLAPKDASQEEIEKLIKEKLASEFGEDKVKEAEETANDPEVQELVKDESLVNTIVNAMDKLDENEWEAFEFFYGDKLIKVIQSGGNGDK